MARSRNIKPGFFKNELLAEMPFEYRLLFIGIWTLADREGRLEYRPKKIQMELPSLGDSSVIEDGIAELADAGFLLIYEVAVTTYLQVINWDKHQTPHHKEVASEIPAPAGHSNAVCHGYFPLNEKIRKRIFARDGRVCKKCGAQHGLSIDHIIPVSRGGNSVDENLQVLCISCNSSKNNKLDEQLMHGSCMNDASFMHDASCPTDSLLSDSLIPDSLIPSTSSDSCADGASQPQVKGKPNHIPVQQIVDLYHEILPVLRRVDKITAARRSACQQRWRDDLPTLDAWRNYFQDVAKSPFLLGRGPPRSSGKPWRADFEWLCKEGNFAKVLEGKYHS